MLNFPLISDFMTILPPSNSVAVKYSKSSTQLLILRISRVHGGHVQCAEKQLCPHMSYERLGGMDEEFGVGPEALDLFLSHALEPLVVGYRGKAVVTA